jgi:hypothetical protein
MLENRMGNARWFTSNVVLDGLILHHLFMKKTEFNDIVTINSRNPDLEEINGMKGVISGYSESDSEIYCAVSVNGIAWMVLEDELLKTGQKEAV